MPNIANVLKSEITRIVRKELRSESAATKKAMSSYRSQIAQLKRQVKALEQQLKKTSKAERKTAALEQPEDETGGSSIRFSAKGLVAQRKRLDLSVVAAAKILGVSGQSVANWESGKTRPRESQLVAIAALRKMGKKDVAAKLAS
ncbi:helix-turn-helix domain-containing protein [Noviherbaspirillum denitrificans]|uniref:XRE family transcriptional regulator n=1 Tax=Noviherbaspirillum denitrificans TaxID=1968433 RepID=A0A254TFM7_9BURK|nr:helix-turn-helix transcriptional regulator [Noviherbaspirillum denitrificans]OWW21345.1 XRE family transcriptional regulator [Noviherbaspirillum denitrificans]